MDGIENYRALISRINNPESVVDWLERAHDAICEAARINKDRTLERLLDAAEKSIAEAAEDALTLEATNE